MHAVLRKDIYMRIQVNGENRSVSDDITITQLLERLGIRMETVAVELNELVVKREKLSETILKEGDVVEIVRMVGGGAQSCSIPRVRLP